MKARVLETVQFTYPSKEGGDKDRKLFVLGSSQEYLEGLSLEGITPEDAEALQKGADLIEKVVAKYARTNYRKFIQNNIKEK